MTEIRVLAGVIFTIGIFATTNANAMGETIYGPILGSQIITDLFYEQYGVKTVYCDKGTTGAGKDLVIFDADYEYVSVRYDGIVTDAIPHVFLTNCEVMVYGCGPDSYVDSSGCTECPNGTAVMENDGMHREKQCRNDLCQENYFYVPQISKCIQCNEYSHPHATNHNYNFCNCNENYYWADTTCLECPDGGWTPAAQNVATDITQCYLKAGDYKDQTGYFTIIGEKCYYEK